jgi:hypothetical protein
MTIEANNKELLMLANGIPSQAEVINRMSTRNYYGLMEFILKKRIEESKNVG